MEAEQIFELLEGRARKLRLLAGHLLAGQQAFARWDLEAVEEYNVRQEETCRELLEIDREIRALSLPDPSRDRRLRGILRELESLRLEVLRVNNIQAEFLKRSRRSVNVLSNIVLGALGTYQPPRTQFPVANAQQGGR